GFFQAGDKQRCWCKRACRKCRAQRIDRSRIRCKQQRPIKDDRHHRAAWWESFSDLINFEKATPGQVRAKGRNRLWLAGVARMRRNRAAFPLPLEGGGGLRPRGGGGARGKRFSPPPPTLAP